MFKSRSCAAGVGAALTLAVLVGAIPASGANLLPNGGFDATAAGSLTGWQWAKATASVTLVAGEGSGHAAQVGVAGTATSYQVYASPRPVSSAAAGSGFVAAGDIRSDTPGRSVCLVLREVSAAGSTVGSAQRCTTTTSTWSPLAPLPYSIKTSGDSLAYLVTQTHAVVGDKFQLDNLTLSTATADTTPPSMPTGFTVTGSTSTSISTSWKPSTDDVGVTGYKLGGPQVATTTATSYTFSTLVCGTSYALGVTALDAAGNTSAQAQLTGQTAPCQTGPPTPSLRSILQNGSTTSATLAGFRFTDTQTGVAYRCTLDGSAPEACTSPANFAGLADGDHVFAVQAVDSSGIASPATSISWTISQPAAVTPCGLTQTPPATYSHVIVIVFENENASDIIGGLQTPYTTQLAAQCAQATQDFAVRRPSLPNYIALTSGSTQGIIDNRLPSYHQIAADNIFHQAETAGMTWRQYSSLMPSNCDKTNDPQTNPYYVVHHEPAVYYTDLASTCPTWAEPLGTTRNGALANDLAANTLPALAWIGPADDGGDVALGGEVDPALGDFFLRDWISQIVSSPAYQSGTTAILITWDEGDLTHAPADPACQNVPLLVVAPSIQPGTVTAASLNHYAVLKAAENMLGLPLLGGAADPATPDIRAILGF